MRILLQLVWPKHFVRLVIDHYIFVAYFALPLQFSFLTSLFISSVGVSQGLFRSSSMQYFCLTFFDSHRPRIFVVCQ